MPVTTPPCLCPGGSNPCGRYGHCAWCPHDGKDDRKAGVRKPDNLVALHKQETGSYHCAHKGGIDGWALDKIERLRFKNERLRERLAECAEKLEGAI